MTIIFSNDKFPTFSETDTSVKIKNGTTAAVVKKIPTQFTRADIDSDVTVEILAAIPQHISVYLNGEILRQGIQPQLTTGEGGHPLDDQRAAMHFRKVLKQIQVFPNQSDQRQDLAKQEKLREAIQQTRTQRNDNNRTNINNNSVLSRQSIPNTSSINTQRYATREKCEKEQDALNLLKHNLNQLEEQAQKQQTLVRNKRRNPKANANSSSTNAEKKPKKTLKQQKKPVTQKNISNKKSKERSTFSAVQPLSKQSVTIFSSFTTSNDNNITDHGVLFTGKRP